MNRIGLLVCALAIGLAPVAADAGHKWDKGPPPWASAHGYRHKQEHRQHTLVPRRHHRSDDHFRRGDERRAARWRVPSHRRKFHERESAIIGGLVGGAIGGLLGNSRPAAFSPYYAPDGQWAPPLFGGPAASQARYCREFSKNAYIHGRHQQIYGLACRQPDGSWEVVSVDR
jgi:hypothetical protein